jgi:hypothetical protein
LLLPLPSGERARGRGEVYFLIKSYIKNNYNREGENHESTQLFKKEKFAGHIVYLFFSHSG